MPGNNLNLHLFCAASGKTWHDLVADFDELHIHYDSLNPISDLGSEGVFPVAKDVPEGEVAVHNIYYPLNEAAISYHYAVTCTDRAGNTSETFGTSSGAYTNTGKMRAIISLDPPTNFVADADLSEWEDIVPF